MSFSLDEVMHLTLKGIGGSSMFHEVRAITGNCSEKDGRTYYKISYANKPCRCTTCRNSDEYKDCAYLQLRAPDSHEMTKKLPTDGVREPDPEMLQLLNDVGRIIGCAPKDLTCAKCVSYCRQYELPVSGLKKVLLHVRNTVRNSFWKCA